MTYFLSLILIISDQVVKLLIEMNLNIGGKIPVIENFFYITHITNKGAAWGMFQDMNIIFLPITIATLFGLWFFRKRYNHFLYRFSSALIAGGALGNFIDRLYRPDGVVDFLEFHFGSYIFPIFNLADIFVVVGGILIGIYLIWVYKEDEEEEFFDDNETI